MRGLFTNRTIPITEVSKRKIPQYTSISRRICYQGQNYSGNIFQNYDRNQHYGNNSYYGNFRGINNRFALLEEDSTLTMIEGVVTKVSMIK